MRVNRAPVLTLWGAVVAERLGHDRDAALTLGKALAGLSAQSKGRRLGIYHEPADAETKKRRPRAGATTVELAGRRIPAIETDDGLRATRDGAPESPKAVERYLESKFGDALPEVRAAMAALARSLPKGALAKQAFALYERFRPEIAAGEKGWGQKGELDVARIRKLARK